MSEWGMTPKYINYEMSEEQLALLLMKRNERIAAMNNPKKNKETPHISEDEYMSQMGSSVYVHKSKGNA